MRNVARIKLGYYPLPHAEGLRLRKLLVFEDGASAVDPCVGTGAALHLLTEGAEVEKHGVELDAGRAAAASASWITTVHGNLFDTIGKSESFSFLYLNPPYDSEIGSMENKRMEYIFLEHTFRWLIEGGVLLMVVPQERLDPAIPLLAGNFTGLCIFRLTDPEAERFDQVALFGVRKRMPSSTPAPLVYRGLPLDQIEDVVLTRRPCGSRSRPYSCREKRCRLADRSHLCMRAMSGCSARPVCRTGCSGGEASGTSRVGGQ